MTLTHSSTPATSDPTAAQRHVRLERLVTAASAGDAEAIAELVERFAPRVRRVARAHRLGAPDVEDVMQTTWLRLLQHVDRIRNPNAIGAWLESTARQESIRVLKSRSRERPTEDDEVFEAPAPPVEEQHVRLTERCADALETAVEQLPRHQRDLVSLLFTDPAPRYDEISRTLGIPIGSIGPTRARSLARLRRNQNLVVLAEECLAEAC
jgi:RNA polymerase sigma factor (sigma-70 family)